MPHAVEDNRCALPAFNRFANSSDTGNDNLDDHPTPNAEFRFNTGGDNLSRHLMLPTIPKFTETLPQTALWSDDSNCKRSNVCQQRSAGRVRGFTPNRSRSLKTDLRVSRTDCRVARDFTFSSVLINPRGRTAPAEADTLLFSRQHFSNMSLNGNQTAS